MTSVESQLDCHPSVTLAEPAVFGYHDLVACPVCECPLSTIGTPRVPDSAFEDPDAFVHSLVPVFAYRCGNHRNDVVVPLAPDEVPDVARLFHASVDGQVRAVGVPGPEVVR